MAKARVHACDQGIASRAASTFADRVDPTMMSM